MKLVPILMALIFSTNILASGAPKLDNLSLNDVDSISKEFATNFTHTILAPASSLGKIWGFEFGFMAGTTQTPEINRISKTISASSNISMIPTAGFIAGLTLPLGINAEVNTIPEVNASSLYLKNISYALKWEMTSVMPTAPLNVAIRIHGNNGELGYTGVINNVSTANQDVNAKTSWQSSSSGYNLEISKKLLFIEPYLGFGKVSTTTKIGISGTSNISIFTFSSASSHTSKNSGSHLFAGVNFNLFILKLGAEYSQMMGISKTAAKVSFYF